MCSIDTTTSLALLLHSEILRGAPLYDQYIANTWDQRLQPKMVGGE